MLNKTVGQTLDTISWTNWGEVKAGGPVVAVTDDRDIFINIDGSTRDATSGEVSEMLRQQYDEPVGPEEE